MEHLAQDDRGKHAGATNQEGVQRADANGQTEILFGEREDGGPDCGKAVT